jgi:SAM-dependent methyltransferase
MPSVDENRRLWTDWDWRTDGHEWSEAWGTAADQWASTILPRIFSLLPTSSILEIAPGYGRWTPYLLNNSERYIGIDITEPLVLHCQRLFGALHSRPVFLLGDGFRFDRVRDRSISLVFSFDSLVHAEMDCLSSYAREIYRVLEPGGHAFIHHSNSGEYVKNGKLTVPNPGWRAQSVTAESVHNSFSAAGLICLTHEKITWLQQDYTDCFSLVRKPRDGNTGLNTKPNIFYNDQFRNEVLLSKSRSEKYTKRLNEFL